MTWRQLLIDILDKIPNHNLDDQVYYVRPYDSDDARLVGLPVPVIAERDVMFEDGTGRRLLVKEGDWMLSE